ncbi:MULTISPECIES: winged helix-turn-helix domain-containing protein [Kitasatospora]|uniref:Putative regulatory protein n=1 Tax=Kitasatospora setae (strain ATCC 33774 / DSM 43861 / JCM 3304 / KCC A-0304 / NBRC 14216 / KM-6054) TaxID=452652 RepID=E4N1L3_KITSK|nr:MULTISPECIES: winged helix-turn-helix domain-containing protein [Kitasatospora]BAJ32047.1 putative regulatory protein [Kitasatospora setae KM-6054]
MSYAATATTSTPHLRAVRALPGLAPTAPEHRRPAPARQAVPTVPTVAPAPESLLAGLQDGAAVVAALPQSVLPQGLLAQLGAANSPLVGYLVLVPAEAPAPAAPTPVAAPAAPVAARPFTRPADNGISVDLDRRNAYVDGVLLDLTYLEFELLAHLTEHPHRVHTRDQLVHTVWGYGHVGDGRTVDVHVARLRRKLGAAYRDTIVTVRRVGYKYAPAA